jgi:HPr kinase/phosphorylase
MSAASLAAPSTRVHGTLVEIRGVGVLLLGRSGIGKSECAIELVVRGHRLVADDVVLIGKGESGGAVGQSPELIRHYLELRGIGIVHVPSLFGPEAIADSATIDLVVRLHSWGQAEVDRTGLEQHSHQIGGFSFPCVELPVAPGRNIATLVDVAARNFLLLRQGQSGAGSLDDRVTRSLKERS